MAGLMTKQLTQPSIEKHLANFGREPQPLRGAGSRELLACPVTFLIARAWGAHLGCYQVLILNLPRTPRSTSCPVV